MLVNQIVLFMVLLVNLLSQVMAGRADKTGKKTQLEIGLFDCAKCKKTFRATLSKKKI